MQQLRENSIGGTRCGNRGSALQSPAAEADFTSSCGLDDDSGVVAQDRVETVWGRIPFVITTFGDSTTVAFRRDDRVVGRSLP